jgi:hypothetical protein
MKPLKLLAALGATASAMACVAPTFAHAEPFVMLGVPAGQKPGERIVFVDQATVQRTTTRPSAWFVVVLSPPVTLKGRRVAALRHREQVSCSDDTMRNLGFTSLDGQGKVIETVGEATRTVRPTQGSTGAVMIAYLCGRRPDAIPQPPSLTLPGLIRQYGAAR